MFLFSKKYKTPISTYTDSYRPPCSVKKTTRTPAPLQPWKENKFVTQGLTMPPVQNPASQGQPEHLIKVSTQEYYRNTIDPAAYWPEKYWLARSEEKYNPVFVHKDKYNAWRTVPYNSEAWYEHSSYLPLLAKDTRMETYLHSIPVPHPPKPTCLNQSEREAVANMPHRLPMCTVTGRGPFQGYYSSCSGCHYCLRGIDYYVDGASAIRRHLHEPEERAEYPVLQLQPQSNALYIYRSPPVIVPIHEP
ncbi:Spermatid-specific manchette-related protein 1 [Leptosomus discolor]|uniref:spermatid-specific manchette-related protein 1 n=1 Tax=Leptosomus discolor TaxID=188344 RepID=UPI000522DB3F|nr:PREDICTED: spermatid-specific manchette-related protein 1 [Leptosomus discolor]KFP95775.1 Spermatid-specific manchette-related protein 1 [Leptosomus discolor]